MRGFEGSYVDESLFGPSKKTKLRNGGRKLTGQTSKTTAIYLPRNELKRMEQLSIVITPQLAIKMRKEKKRQLEAKMKESFDRKQEIMRKEEVRKANLPPDVMQVEKFNADKIILDKAKHLINEDKDDIKGMKGKMAYAMTVGVRDAQVKEKIIRIQREKLVEKRTQIKIELERLRTVKYYKDRDHQRKIDDRRASKGINVQIEEAQQRRKKQLEIKRKEQIVLKARGMFYFYFLI